MDKTTTPKIILQKFLESHRYLQLKLHNKLLSLRNVENINLEFKILRALVLVYFSRIIEYR